MGFQLWAVSILQAGELELELELELCWRDRPGRILGHLLGRRQTLDRARYRRTLAQLCALAEREGGRGGLSGGCPGLICGLHRRHGEGALKNDDDDGEEDEQEKKSGPILDLLRGSTE